MTTKEEFDESCNFDVVAKVSKEAVSEFDIRQLSADEVIYVTDTKADVDRAVNHLAGLAKDKPQDWEPDQKTIKLIADKLADVCSDLMGGYHDESEYAIFRHGMQTQVNAVTRMIIKSARQVAIDEALEVFTGMISPSENQLGVLYDAGYLLPKK